MHGHKMKLRKYTPREIRIQFYVPGSSGMFVHSEVHIYFFLGYFH